MCLFGQAFVGWGLSSFVGCDGSQHYQLHSLLRDSTLLPSLLRDSTLLPSPLRDSTLLPSLLRDSLHPQDTTPHRRDQHHLKHRSNHASNKHTHLNKR